MRRLSDAQVTARQASGVHPGSAEFRTVLAALPVARRDVLTRLADWAETLKRDGLVRLLTYRGNSGTALLPYLLTDDAGLVTFGSPAEEGRSTCVTQTGSPSNCEIVRGDASWRPKRAASQP
jgi:hypothetical protein